jgi:hypothetical protein
LQDLKHLRWGGVEELAERRFTRLTRRSASSRCRRFSRLTASWLNTRAWVSNLNGTEASPSSRTRSLGSSRRGSSCCLTFWPRSIPPDPSIRSPGACLAARPRSLVSGQAW